jgi:hypothetical protein
MLMVSLALLPLIVPQIIHVSIMVALTINALLLANSHQIHHVQLTLARVEIQLLLPLFAPTLQTNLVSMLLVPLPLAYVERLTFVLVSSFLVLIIRASRSLATRTETVIPLLLLSQMVELISVYFGPVIIGPVIPADQKCVTLPIQIASHTCASLLPEIAEPIPNPALSHNNTWVNVVHVLV